MTDNKIVHVNEHDEVVGDTTIHEAMAQHLIPRIIRVMVFDDAGRLYIQRRSLNMEVAPGQWDLSTAGHVDVGESYDQAAVRELEEELGLKNLTLNLRVNYYSEEKHPKHKLIKRFNALYSADYDGQEITLAPTEVIDGKWISIADLEKWMDDKPDEFSSGFLTAYRKYKEAI